MAINAGSIYSSIFLKLDQLDKGITQVHAKLNQLNKTSQTKAGGFASFWKNAFQTAFGFGIVQLIGKVTAAIKESIAIFSGFQQSMKNVQSVTDATEAEFRAMTEAAKEAGETTRFTAREAADALYYLGSAGFTAQQSISALDGVLQLAGATQSDLASTSETVASIISQYSLQASDAAKISNIFAAAIGNSQATMDKLTNSFRQVGPVAAGFGYSVEETVGALQELYNAGFQGQQAGRALKSALADLASPTANLEKILTKYGIALNQVNPANVELADIITILGEKGLTTADIIDGFGKVAGPQMAVLIKQGGDALRKYTADVTNTEAAAEAYAIQNDSLAGGLDFLRSKLEGTAIAIFEKLEPGMRELIDSFITYLDALKPVGQLLGSVLNIFLKFSSMSLKPIIAIMNTLTGGFEVMRLEMERADDGLIKVTNAIKRAGELGDTAKKINDLTDEYEELQSKTDLTESEQDRLKSVIMEIHKIVPDATITFDEYGNAIALSGEKSRNAARQMLIAREATISNALTQLKASEAMYKNIIRENEARVQFERQNRKRLISESNIAEARIALLEKFNTEFELQQDRLIYGESIVDAYNRAMENMGDEFENVGLGFKKQITSMNEAHQEFGRIRNALKDSTKTYNEYVKAIQKPPQFEKIYEDAKKQLDEIANLEKQLINIQKEIKDIDKIDPVKKDAPKKADELNDKINDFWKNYRNQIQAATREAELFGNKQDVLKASLDFLKNAYLELLEQGLKPTNDIMQKLRMEYDLTLLELNALIEAEKQHTEELQNKEKIEQDIISMTEDYRNKIEEIGKSEKELIELERNRALISIYASGASEEAIEKAAEAINIYYDKLKENSEQTKEQVKITFDEMFNYAQQLASALIGLWQTITQARLDELDKQMQAEMEAAGVAEETERERLERELEEAKKAGDKKRQQEIKNEMKRLEIKEKYEKEAAMIIYKGALFEWKLTLAAAFASAAQAVLSGYATKPFIPVGLAAGTLALALGGLQVANVNAQKPKPPEFESGGVFLGPDQQYAGGGGVPAVLHPPETILNGEQMKKVFDMINNGNTGGPASIPVSVSVMLDSYIIGKIVEDMANGGQITFKPERALRK